MEAIQRLSSVARDRLWVRLLVLAALAMVGLVWVMPDEIRRTVAMKAAYYSPHVLIPLAVGAIAAWVGWNRRAFFWGCAISFVLIECLVYAGFPA